MKERKYRWCHEVADDADGVSYVAWMDDTTNETRAEEPTLVDCDSREGVESIWHLFRELCFDSFARKLLVAVNVLYIARKDFDAEKCQSTHRVMMLEHADEYLSPENMCDGLEKLRKALCEHCEHLHARGYVITVPITLQSKQDGHLLAGAMIIGDDLFFEHPRAEIVMLDEHGVKIVVPDALSQLDVFKDLHLETVLRDSIVN
jgi:biotin operon repressor